MKTQQLATFAERHNINPVAAVVLPALFSRAANKVEMDENELIAQSLTNPALGNYMAELANKLEPQVVEVLFAEQQGEVETLGDIDVRHGHGFNH